MTEEELLASVAGGASSFAMGELGEGVEQMVTHWRAFDLPEDLVDALAEKAITDGGVWADPPTLASRVGQLQGMLPLLPLERLMRMNPAIVELRPRTVQLKLEALSAALPRVDVLRMVHARPSLLSRSPAFLQARSRTLLGLLPRNDLDAVAVEAPQLLETAPAELTERASILCRLYSRVTIQLWKRPRLIRMLMTPATRLRRVEHVSRVSPGLRVAVPDQRFLNMAESTWHKRFIERPRSQWKRRLRRATPTATPDAFASQLFEGVELPARRLSLLRWGAEYSAHARTAQALPAAEGAALLPLPDPAGSGDHDDVGHDAAPLRQPRMHGGSKLRQVPFYASTRFHF